MAEDSKNTAIYKNSRDADFLSLESDPRISM